MTRSFSVARSSGARPLSMIGSTLLALCLVGCAGSLPENLKGGGGGGGSGGGGSGGGTVPDVMCSDGMKATVKIIMTCGQTAICHDATAASAGGLILNTANVLVGNLLDKNPTAKSTLCSKYGGPYLKGGSNPATGLFLNKLVMTPACGASMPFAKPLLPQADIDCLTQWATAVTSPGSSGGSDAGAGQ